MIQNKLKINIDVKRNIRPHKQQHFIIGTFSSLFNVECENRTLHSINTFRSIGSDESWESPSNSFAATRLAFFSSNHNSFDSANEPECFPARHIFAHFG